MPDNEWGTYENMWGIDIPDWRKPLSRLFSNIRSGEPKENTKDEVRKDDVREEIKWFQFLISRFGFFGAFSIRGKYTGQDYTQSPEYKEWVRIGKPSNVSGVSDLGGYSYPPPETKPVPTIGESMVGTAVTPETGFDWSAPWVQKGISKEEFASRYPEEYSDYQTEQQAKQLGVSKQDLLRKMMGFPTSEEEGLEREKFGFEKQVWRDKQAQDTWAQLKEADKVRWLAQGEQAQLENTRLMNRMRGDRGFEEEQAYQEKLSRDFESMRSMFTSPRNWIEYNLPNPYKSRERNPDENLFKAQEEAKLAESAWKDAQKLEKIAASDPYISLSPEQKNVIDIAKTHWVNTTDRLVKLETARSAGMSAGLTGQVDIPDTGIGESEQIEAGRWAAERPHGEGTAVGKPSSEPESKMPQIPGWLQTVSGVKGRVPEVGTKVNILTPSGQSWTAMNPTQQSMWGGLVGWAGNRSEADILDQMRKQLPQSPSLGRTWKPARQMV